MQMQALGPRTGSCFTDEEMVCFPPQTIIIATVTISSKFTSQDGCTSNGATKARSDQGLHQRV